MSRKLYIIISFIRYKRGIYHVLCDLYRYIRQSAYRQSCNGTSCICLPFSYIVNEVEHQCLDLSAFDGDAYYEMLRHTPASTSMISMDQYRQLWEPLLEEGHDILHVGMSSGISGAYQSAVMAARELREEYPQRRLVVFDTRAASLGEGIQVLHAATCREAGYTLDETVRELAELRPRIRQIFTVDDLMHLRRGGRVSGVAAAVGTALRIKPLLKGDEAGRIVVFGKVPGPPSAPSVRWRTTSPPTPSCWAAGHRHRPRRMPGRGAALAAMLKESDPKAVSSSWTTSPVTGSHVGPGALAMFYVAKEPWSSAIC